MAQQQTGLNSHSRQYLGRRRSNSSSCVSDSSDRSSELEVDSLPSRPYSSIGMQRPRIPNVLGDVDLVRRQDIMILYIIQLLIICGLRTLRIRYGQILALD